MKGEEELGYVYVLTNPAIPGLVKIGCTTRDPEARARELNGTGLPQPYTVLWHSGPVVDHRALEQRTHAALEPLRDNPGREFFRIDPREAVEEIERIAKRWGHTHHEAGEAGHRISETDRSTARSGGRLAEDSSRDLEPSNVGNPSRSRRRAPSHVEFDRDAWIRKVRTRKDSGRILRSEDALDVDPTGPFKQGMFFTFQCSACGRPTVGCRFVHTFGGRVLCRACDR